MLISTAALDRPHFCWKSRRLWSLWDMLAKLDKIVQLLTALDALEKSLEKQSAIYGPDASHSGVPAGDSIIDGATALATSAESIIPSTAAQVVRIGGMIKSGATISEYIAA